MLEQEWKLSSTTMTTLHFAIITVNMILSHHI
uniref:Uncharacterized protein n=1 Tax=Heterorhabditis bacteriophora TaxID=37862 RepID=A0A1I7WDR1_HETBA